MTEAERELTHKVLRRAAVLMGGQSAMGRELGVSQQTVSYWLTRRYPAPADHVIAIEAATGISRHELRPDIYPVEDHQTPAPQPGAASGAIPDAPDAPVQQSPGVRPSETPGASPPAPPGVPETKDAA